ncbi:MAG TPA: PQQ-binding-like beta-propeller repeat protein [Vicinamibacterales bacterium]|jgi:outer membrane protein assembly factor BamB
MSTEKPLRLWPGVAAAVLVLLGLVLPFVSDAVVVGLLGGIGAAFAIVVWWVFFSRLPWLERLGAITLAVVAGLATRPLLHTSIAGAGMGMLFPMYSIQIVSIAFVVSAALSRGLTGVARYAAMAATIVLAFGFLTMVRTGGIMGEGRSDLHWRWTPSPEDRLLARAEEVKPLPPSTPPPEPVKDTPSPPANVVAAPAAVNANATTAPAIGRPAEWPGFRGPERNGVIRGVRIATDWSTSPPVEMWRRPIGPGWSSFAVHGDLLYTQEQRGNDEIVAAYRVGTGAPVWRHRDPVRFYESNGGAGPRATPTISNGRAYTFGATGVLNALDERTGAVIWSRNVATDSKTEVPMWGFASSPLVIDNEVVVAAAGTLAAYDIASGKPRWFGPAGGMSYSSPHRITVDGVPQIVLLSGGGATSVAPGDGTVLWKHMWGDGAIVQPGVTENGNLLINSLTTTGGQGIRRIAISHEGGKAWTVDERWTSTGLKPYYNDFVVHKGYAFGFDGSILACIDLADGSRKWKGGRYGAGQLVLLADQDLLLVSSEEGDIALVSATPDQFKEISRFKAIDGKTWNHPVVVGDILLVRNGEEMAAFRLRLVADSR